MADPNGSNPATPGTAPAAAPASAPTAPAAPAPAWYEPHIPDPDTRAFVERKGWTDVNNIVKSYQGVEKLIGRDPDTLLTMPKAGDVEGERAMWSKLGLPADSKGYDLKTWAGDLPFDEGYNAKIAEIFHGANLTTKQAERFVKEHNAYIKTQMEVQTKEYEAQVAAEKQALMAEWKGGHERMLNLAQGAAKSLGFDAAAFDGIEKAIGYGKTMKLFAELGRKLGEDKFITQDQRIDGFSNMLSPEQAKQAWEAMKLDSNVMIAIKDRNHPGHKAAVEKQTRLFNVMYPS